MSDKEIIKKLIEYNSLLTNRLAADLPQWYTGSSLITEIDEFYKDNIDGTEYEEE